MTHSDETFEIEIVTKIRCNQASMQAAINNLVSAFTGLTTMASTKQVDLVPRNEYAKMVGLSPETVSKRFKSGELLGEYKGPLIFIYRDQQRAKVLQEQGRLTA